ncbi:11081_t:CDS:2, partial [Ambispora leptoticha]
VEDADVYFEVRGFDTNGGLPTNLKRGLEARHLTMISIGGTIGTGLFLASGGAIASGGPGGALVAYMIVGLMIYFMMASLGEMATYLPISGSFNTYAKRYIDPALGFALGWNYWYSWSITVAVEITAGSIVMKYWVSSIPNWVWSLILLSIMFGLNLFSVRGYGEAEYWFSLTKLLTVLVFIIVGFLLDLGFIGDPPTKIGGSVFDSGAFHAGFTGLFSVFLAAGFSFQGTELVGIAAGESSNPRKHVPKAIRQVFWRILLFYILAIFVIGLLIRYDDPRLLNNSGPDGVAVSPFTLVFSMTGFTAAPHLMNAVIMITVLSAGNSGLYASSRVLYNLALDGFAPKIFSKTNSNGIPVMALLMTTGMGCFAFFMSFFGDGRVYTWLLNLSGVSGFITWAGISFTHWRFRRAYVAQ